MRLLLLSGGMDSTLLLHKYGADLCVGFDYGQPHLIELDYASRIAAHFGTRYVRRRINHLPRVDDVVFAARNAILLSHAAAICQKEDGGGEVVIGCNFDDAVRFRDCLPEFLKSIDKALCVAYSVHVHAPLLTRTKAQIVSEARAVGLPQTWTCYQPDENDLPCGKCYACKGLQC